MRKTIFKNHNIYQLDKAMILKELNKSLIIMGTQCLRMDLKQMNDQLQVLIFNKMVLIQISKLIIILNNLSFRWMIGVIAVHNFKWMIGVTVVHNFKLMIGAVTVINFKLMIDLIPRVNSK